MHDLLFKAQIFYRKICSRIFPTVGNPIMTGGFKHKTSVLESEQLPSGKTGINLVEFSY